MFELGDIEAAVKRAKRLPGLATNSHWWLTLCITGPQPSLERVAAALVAEEGENLHGADTGFLNAKLRAPSEPGVIAQTIGRVHALAISTGAELVSVDADASPDVTRSTFSQLWVA